MDNKKKCFAYIYNKCIGVDLVLKEVFLAEKNWGGGGGGGGGGVRERRMLQVAEM